LYYKTYSGTKVYLSPPSASDADNWAQWLNDTDISLPLGDEYYSTITPDKIRSEIQNYSNYNLNYYIFSICLVETGEPIGRCIIFLVDYINRSGTLGIFLGNKAHWGKGYAKEALELLLEFGFSIINLHSVSLGVFEFNKRALALYQKLGFNTIGIKRETRLVNGTYHNTVMMDMLASEYKVKHLKFDVE